MRMLTAEEREQLAHIAAVEAGDAAFRVWDGSAHPSVHPTRCALAHFGRTVMIEEPTQWRSSTTELGRKALRIDALIRQMGWAE